MSMKLSFSLKGKNNNKGSSSLSTSTAKKAALDGFEGLHEEPKKEEEFVHPDLKAPLVIPVQQNSRLSLQEQGRSIREQEQQLQEDKLSKEDQEAINALKKEASGDIEANSAGNSRVIPAQENAFQSAEQKEMQQFKEDVEKLAPDLSVDSESYQKVPIADFGAALLRGMGWRGSVDKSDTANSLPRPSRLGLGATPKLLDVPTHKRGRRRQDQVQREKQLKEQQQEYERQRLEQIKKDKQRTIQVGSIVSVGDKDRAIIRQWNGVPGLNMILVQFEGYEKATKVKKGIARLLSRQELDARPFQEPDYCQSQKTEYLGQKKHGEENEKGHRHRSDDERRDRKGERYRSSRDEDDHDKRERPRVREYDNDDRRKKRRHEDEDQRRRCSDDEDDRRNRRHEKDTGRRKSRERDGRSGGDKRRRGDVRDDEYSKRSRNQYSSSENNRHSTWLVPNIRVRVITSKYGRSHDKKKGVVVDVTLKGATLKMDNGDILQGVSERYLETALPKVGGNAIILTGNHRFAKGKLLERDSRANKGALQLFEEMNIVNTSLDDMAEWCLPLDDDLMD